MSSVAMENSRPTKEQILEILPSAANYVGKLAKKSNNHGLCTHSTAFIKERLNWNASIEGYLLKENDDGEEIIDEKRPIDLGSYRVFRPNPKENWRYCIWEPAESMNIDRHTEGILNTTFGIVDDCCYDASILYQPYVENKESNVIYLVNEKRIEENLQRYGQKNEKKD